MNLDFKNIDLIPAIQSAVEAIQNDGKPFFMFGHIKEIAHQLGKKSKLKYPLVILPLDLTSNYSNRNFKTVEFTNVTIFIVSFTNENYIAYQRKTNVFDTVLIPIYEDFITELKQNVNFDGRKMIPFPEHTKTDRYFWGSLLNPGTTTKSVMGDPLDCIELNFKSLFVKNLNC